MSFSKKTLKFQKWKKNIKLDRKYFKSILSSSRNFTNFPSGVATAHRKLGKLWETRLIVINIDFLGRETLVVVIKRALFSAGLFGLIFAVIKTEIWTWNVPIILIFSFGWTLVFFLWFLLILSVYLHTFLLSVLTLIFEFLFLICILLFFLLIFVHFIRTVFILFKAFFEVLFLNFTLISKSVSLNQIFYFTFGFLFEIINFWRFFIDKITIWGIWLLMWFFKFFVFL